MPLISCKHVTWWSWCQVWAVGLSGFLFPNSRFQKPLIVGFSCSLLVNQVLHMCWLSLWSSLIILTLSDLFRRIVELFLELTFYWHLTKWKCLLCFFIISFLNAALLLIGFCLINWNFAYGLWKNFLAFWWLWFYKKWLVMA